MIVIWTTETRPKRVAVKWWPACQDVVNVKESGNGNEGTWRGEVVPCFSGEEARDRVQCQSPDRVQTSHTSTVTFQRPETDTHCHKGNNEHLYSSVPACPKLTQLKID